MKQYEKQNFENGQVLSASHLNTIEDGLVNLCAGLAEVDASIPVVCDVSGEIVSVTDASDRPIRGLTICGKTAQNGTPSPSNPVPLVNVGSGGSIAVTVAGSNLFDESWFLKAVNWTESGGVYTGFVSRIRQLTNSGDFPVTFAENTQYKISLSARYVSSAPNARWGITYTDGTYQNIFFFGNQPTMTYAEGVTHAGKAVQSISMDYGSDTQIEIKEMCISLASVGASYEPYKPIQTIALPTPNGLPGIPVSSGGNYTDSNGQQWICDEIDLARGVYVQWVERVIYDGDEAWSTYGESNNNLNFLIWPTNVKIGWQLSKCDYFQNVTMAWDTSHAGEYGIYADHPSVTGKYFRPPNSNITTLAQWNAWLAEHPITLVYALAEPVETPLDADTLAAYAALHSNKPNTTVLNDAGTGQKLGYVADTKLYIDHKFTELQSAIIAAGANI